MLFITVEKGLRRVFDDRCKPIYAEQPYSFQIDLTFFPRYKKILNIMLFLLFLRKTHALSYQKSRKVKNKNACGLMAENRHTHK
jgi:hypothetical protein